MNARRITVALCLVVALCACSSSSASRTVETSTTRPASTPRAALRFRAVVHEYPWAARCKTLVAKSPPDTAGGRSVVLPGRGSQHCFVLGPALTSPSSVDAAAVAYDQAASAWAVNVHFANDEFLTNVARPEVGKTVAMDVDGVVQSAPIINAGITGREVEISAGFSKDQAVDLAASLIGVAPSAVHVDASGAPA